MENNNNNWIYFNFLSYINRKNILIEIIIKYIILKFFYIKQTHY